MFTSPKEFTLNNETGHADTPAVSADSRTVSCSIRPAPLVTAETGPVGMDFRYYGSNCPVFNVKLARQKRSNTRS